MQFRIGFFTIVLNFVFQRIEMVMSVVICWLLSATRFCVLLNCDAFGLRLVSGCQFVHAFVLSLRQTLNLFPVLHTIDMLLRSWLVARVSIFCFCSAAVRAFHHFVLSVRR